MRETQRQEADSVINKALETADNYGSGAAYNQTVARSVNGKDYNQKIRDAHKAARKAIAWKRRDNSRRGRTYGDGKDF